MSDEFTYFAFATDATCYYCLYCYIIWDDNDWTLLRKNRYW